MNNQSLRPFQDGYYVIYTLCTDHKMAITAHSSKIIQSIYKNTDNQKFYIKYEGNGKYSFQCRSSNLYWDIAGSNKRRLAQLIQWNKTLNDNQLFKFIECDNNEFGLMAVHSKKYLDIKRDDNSLIQWPWHGGENQRFIFNRCDI